MFDQKGEKTEKSGGRPALWLAPLVLCFFLILPVALPAEEVVSEQDPATGREDFYDPWDEDPLDEDPLDEDPWDDDPWDDDPWAQNARDDKTLADPLEPLNRVFFTFNDRLYVWVLDPVARGYASTLPEDVRLCFRRFFRNLKAPVRVVNHLLQGRVRDSGTELARFTINTTVGIAGLTDPAADTFGIKQRDADLGQTLGIYGLGDGFYINWPLAGPSTLRDSVGAAGDSLVNPLSRLMAQDPRAGAAAYSGRTVNNVSLRLGEYERFTAAAFDPYIAVRDAYWQHRRSIIRDRGKEDSEVPALFSDADEVGP